ncbi:MAG: hypothetical protein ABJQ69_03790 [Ekhidna sp.]
MSDQSTSNYLEENSRESTGYELDDLDVKFLKAVNVIVQKNAAFGIEPRTINSLSKMLFSDRAIISKIKASQRGVSKNQRKIFLGFYNLKADWFTAESDFDYNPQDYISYSPVGKKEKKTKVKETIINVNGKGASAGTVYSGEVLGDIIQNIQSAENIINQVPPDVKNHINGVFETIQNKAEDIKKISDGYREQVIDLKKQVEALKKSERKARESERIAKENERTARDAEIAAMKEIIYLKDKMNIK